MAGERVVIARNENGSIYLHLEDPVWRSKEQISGAGYRQPPHWVSDGPEVSLPASWFWEIRPSMKGFYIIDVGGQPIPCEEAEQWKPEEEEGDE